MRHIEVKKVRHLKESGQQEIQLHTPVDRMNHKIIPPERAKHDSPQHIGYGENNRSQFQQVERVFDLEEGNLDLRFLQKIEKFTENYCEQNCGDQILNSEGNSCQR